MLALVVALLILCGGSRSADATLTNGKNASDILGHFSSITNDTTPDYTKTNPNNGPSELGFYSSGVLGTTSPVKPALDLTNHWLFVPDPGNARILVFSLNTNNTIASKTPTYVLGKASLDTDAVGSTLSPYGALVVDPVHQLLYAATDGFSTVQVFNTASMSNNEAPTYVLGAPTYNIGFQAGGNTAALFAVVAGIALDVTNQMLFVSDQNNNRVMVFNVAPGSLATGESATYVLGQTGFGSSTSGTTSQTMSAPAGLGFDQTNELLYVADLNNNRVLVFNVAPGTLATNEAASYELGAPSGASAFTTVSTQNASPSTFSYPVDVVADPANQRIFVSDMLDLRVLVFSTSNFATFNGESASYVLGQTSLTSTTGSNQYFDLNGTFATQSTMDAPSGLALDTSNNLLYVYDQYDSRIMIFPTSSITNGENATDLIGQYASQSSPATVSYTRAGPDNGGNGIGLWEPEDVTLDAVNHRLFVGDLNNGRVLVYNLNTDNSIPSASGGHTATYAIGQPDVYTATTQTTTSASTLGEFGQYNNGDIRLAFDPVNNRLFVADDYCSRILVFNTSTITSGMSASYILGQSSPSACGGSTTKATLNHPLGLAYDSANSRLFVADAANQRIIVYAVAPGTIATGENASFVLGNSSYTTITGGTSSKLLTSPVSVAYDPVNTRLFVADSGNNRVLMFPAAVGTLATNEAATIVIGQTGLSANTTPSSPAANVLYGPTGLAYDSNNSRLFVVDEGFGRVLTYNAGPSVLKTHASAVFELGVPAGSAAFTTAGTGTASQSVFQEPAALWYDNGTNNLYVVDDDGSRVLIFDATFMGSGFLPGYD